jgi:hypothetical protein
MFMFNKRAEKYNARRPFPGKSPAAAGKRVRGRLKTAAKVEIFRKDV